MLLTYEIGEYNHVQWRDAMHLVNITVLFFVSLPWVLPQGTVSNKSCAYFSFENDTLQTNLKELTENTTVTLMFYLKNKTCSSMENISITIRKLEVTTNSYIPQCDIVLKNDTCRNSTHEGIYCGCLNTFGEYMFSKIVSKSDITRWKWTTKDGLADDVYLWFNESLTDWQHISVSTVEESTLSKPATSPARTEATPQARTEDSSQEDKGDEEMYKSIAIAVVTILLLINVFLITVICLRKRGREKMMKSPTCDIDGLDALRLNQTYNGPGDSGALHTDILHNDDFAEIYFSNNLELD